MGAEKVVPREPTPEMITAALKDLYGADYDKWCGTHRDGQTRRMFQAMFDAAPAQPATAAGEAVRYFAADPGEGDFETYGSLDEARQSAQRMLDEAADSAADYGWADIPPQICYGIIAGGCVEESRKPAPEGSQFDEIVNFRLADTHPTPPTLHTAPDAGDGGKQYAERDHMALDRAGGYYCRHVSAMTAEGLHAKSAIAAELAWRDLQLAQQASAYDALAAERSGAHSALVVEEAVNAKLRDKLAAAEAARDAAVGVLKALCDEVFEADAGPAYAAARTLLTEASREG